MAAGRFTKRVARLKLNSTLTTCAPAQAALALFLERGGCNRHLRMLRSKLAAQQIVFIEAVSRYFPKGVLVTRPRGGYFVCMKLPQGVDALRLTQNALKEGISVAPGPIFSPELVFRNCGRLNYGPLWDARTEAALARLDRLVTDMQASG